MVIVFMIKIKKYIKPIWGTNDWSRPEINQDFNKPFNFLINNSDYAYIRYNVVKDLTVNRSNQYIKIYRNNLADCIDKTFYVGSTRLNKHNSFTTLKIMY